MFDVVTIVLAISGIGFAIGLCGVGFILYQERADRRGAKSRRVPGLGGITGERL